MPLPLKIADDAALNALPEPHRALYAKGDDGYTLDIDGGLPDVQGLTKNRDEILTEKKKLEKAIKSLTDRGFTIEKAVEMIDTRKKAETEDEEKTGKWEKTKKNMEDAHATAIGEVNDKLTKRERFIHSLVVENGLLSAITDAEGIPEALTPALSRFVRAKEDGDKFVAEVVDETGTARFGASGKAMTLKELVAEYKKKPAFAGCFKGTGASGSGAQGSSAGGAGGPDFSKIPNPVDRLKAARAAGVTK